MSVHRIRLANGECSYKAVVWLGERRQLTKRFQAKAEAEVWEREQRVRLRTPTKEVAPEIAAMTIGQLAEKWFQSYAKLHLQESTQYKYATIFRRSIEPTFGRSRVADLGHRVVEAWLLRLREVQGLSAKSCNDAIGLLRKMLNDGVRWGYVLANPTNGIRKLKVAEVPLRYWTKDESRTFLEAVQAQEPELFPVFFTGLNTGMRLGEIAGLKWDCVDLERRQIAVRRSWDQKIDQLKETTKTNKTRIVPVNSTLVSLLVELKVKKQDEFVIPRCDFKNLHRSLARHAKVAGVPVIPFHGLRHSFASMWMMAGQSMFELQKVLGHQSIQMTERYSHLAPDHLAGKTEFLAGLATRAEATVIRMLRS